MRKLNQSVELAANILIIVVAALLIGVIVQKYLSSKSSPINQQARVQPTIGT